MKKSTNAKKKSSPKKKSSNKQTSKKKPEIDGLDGAEQPLFYMGPPPALRCLLKNKNEFDKKFHPADLLKHMQEGSSRSEVCAAWGIGYELFNKWLEEKPELAQAFAVGLPAYDGYYKRAVRYSAFGMLKNVREGSLFFLLKNLAGFGENGGDHEFMDGSPGDIEFVDDGE